MEERDRSTDTEALRREAWASSESSAQNLQETVAWPVRPFWFTSRLPAKATSVGGLGSFARADERRRATPPLHAILAISP
jgi:hypothetical protein